MPNLQPPVTPITPQVTPVKKTTPKPTTPKPVPRVTPPTPLQVKNKDNIQLRSQTARSGRVTQVPSKFKDT